MSLVASEALEDTVAPVGAHRYLLYKLIMPDVALKFGQPKAEIVHRALGFITTNINLGGPSIGRTRCPADCRGCHLSASHFPSRSQSSGGCCLPRRTHFTDFWGGRNLAARPWGEPRPGDWRPQDPPLIARLSDLWLCCWLCQERRP